MQTLDTVNAVSVLVVLVAVSVTRRVTAACRRRYSDYWRRMWTSERDPEGQGAGFVLFRDEGRRDR